MIVADTLHKTVRAHTRSRLKLFSSKTHGSYRAFHLSNDLTTCPQLFRENVKVVEETPERNWRKPWTPRYYGGEEISIRLTRKVIGRFLEELDCPRALSVWLLFRSDRDHLQIVDGTLDCKAEMYCDMSDINRARFRSTLPGKLGRVNNVDPFRRAYAATKLLSKCKDLATGIDTEAVAIATALKAEVKNRETNSRFARIAAGVDHDPAADAKARARASIAKILGPAPDIDSLEPATSVADPKWEEMKERLGFTDRAWSNGRTTSAWGDRLSLVCKYQAICDVTPGLVDPALRLVGDTPKWREIARAALEDASQGRPRSYEFLNVVWGNVLLVVPKNAKTDRVICYEPHINIRFQLAVGTYIRQRLARAGVNLNDQTINQRRARLGSKYGRWATIDLRSASDMLARAVVEDLLPEDWFLLLERLRSHSTLWPDGVWRLNHKFSSMGNGFTFELESLIFYALASAVTSSVSVYGDDIIVPTDGFDAVVSVLEACGFEINTSKSFSTGPFRESCGEDAMFGVSVTPIYLKAYPTTLRSLVAFHNQVWAWATRSRVHLGSSVSDGRVDIDAGLSDSAMLDLCRSIRSAFPFYTGPQGLGDGHYHVSFDDAWVWRASAEPATVGWEGWWFQTEIPLYGDRILGKDRSFVGRAAQAALLATLGPQPPREVEGLVANRTVTGYRTIRSLCRKWPVYVGA